eukprot:10774972-Ditylum_brightwellii.AAC.1
MTTTPTEPTLRKSHTCSVQGNGWCLQSPRSLQVSEWQEKASGAGTTQSDLPCMVMRSWRAQETLMTMETPPCRCYVLHIRVIHGDVYGRHGVAVGDSI